MNIIQQDRQLWKCLSIYLEDDIIAITLSFCEKRLWDYESNPGHLTDSNYYETWELFIRTRNNIPICAFDWSLCSEHEDARESEEGFNEKEELELHFSCSEPCVITITDDDEPTIREYLAEHCPTFRAEIDIQRPKFNKKRKQIE
jgi:hypothetical protein